MKIVYTNEYESMNNTYNILFISFNMQKRSTEGLFLLTFHIHDNNIGNFRMRQMESSNDNWLKIPHTINICTHQLFVRDEAL